MRTRDARPTLVLTSVALAQLTATLDMTVVNVALPAMDAGLGLGRSLAWVVNGYALSFGGLLLLGGRAADLFGRRRLLLAGTVLFALASLGGGLAREPWQLIAARVVQGAGAAALVPAALALLTVTFAAGPARNRALGVYSAVSAVGGSVGVLLGGLLAEYAGWRSVMLVNLPLALAVVVTALLGAPGDRGHRARLDVPGAVLATAGASLLILGVARTEATGWTAPGTLAALGGAAVLLVAFCVWEARAAEPLVRPGLLARRPVAGANLFMLLLSAGQFGAFYFVSLYLQDVLRLGPAEAGLAFLPMCVLVFAGIRVSTRLLAVVGARALLVPSGLLTAAGLGWMAFLDAPGSFTGDVLGPSLVLGAGLGIGFVPLTAAATGGLPPHEAGMASAVLSSSRQIGGALGLAVLVNIQAARANALLADGEAPLAAATAGHALGLTVAAALPLAAVAVTLPLLPPRHRPTSPHPAPRDRQPT
ncbi:MFS transporter [Streptomyces avicenniae]|uniref:MFS transporter n=1 Tax=Streptomyces avicenniae TaxID=500153 RepID=UPI00069B8EDC|nr:MFS transporter [Streptomyces avicenniae]